MRCFAASVNFRPSLMKTLLTWELVSRIVKKRWRHLTRIARWRKNSKQPCWTICQSSSSHLKVRTLSNSRDSTLSWNKSLISAKKRWRRQGSSRISLNDKKLLPLRKTWSRSCRVFSSGKVRSTWRRWTTTLSWWNAYAPGRSWRRTLRRQNSKGRWPSVRLISMRTRPRSWYSNFFRLRRCSRKSDDRSASVRRTAPRVHWVPMVVSQRTAEQWVWDLVKSSRRRLTGWLTNQQQCSEDSHPELEVSRKELSATLTSEQWRKIKREWIRYSDELNTLFHGRVDQVGNVKREVNLDTKCKE